MIKLNRYPVVFDSVKHTYFLGEKQLQGITHLIKDKLFPDEYKNVSESVLANAAERGHRIHSVLELFDNTGIYTENCPELVNYIAAREEFPWLANHLASEYIVSDLKQYASGIDKIYEYDGGVILADVKTTYKLNLSYVTWQLSIYAFFFHLLNPDIPVKKAYVIWLRDDKRRIVEVNIIDKDNVNILLYTPEIPKLKTDLTITEEVLRDLKHSAEEAAAAYDAAKQKLLEEMTEKNITKFDGQLFTISLRAGAERKSFDSKAFKADSPDIYEKYVKVSKSAPTISIREKNG